MGNWEFREEFCEKRPAVFNFALCSTFYAGFWDQNQIWQQQAIIEFSCNLIIDHKEYSFISNDLFWNDSSCQFGGLVSPPWDRSLASPLLTHAGSLGLESECTLQCVYVLVCALFHFFFVVMKSMLPDAENASIKPAPARGEEIIKLRVAIAPETWTRRGTNVPLDHDRHTTSWGSSVSSLRFASAEKNPEPFASWKLGCQNDLYIWKLWLCLSGVLGNSMFWVHEIRLPAGNQTFRVPWKHLIHCTTFSQLYICFTES